MQWCVVTLYIVFDVRLWYFIDSIPVYFGSEILARILSFSTLSRKCCHATPFSCPCELFGKGI